MWANYAPSVDGLVYVVDLKDTRRLEESKKELLTTLTYFTEGHIPPILVCVNKFDSEQDSDLQDRANTLVLEDWIPSIERATNEQRLLNRLITVATTSARSGRGVLAAFDQFSTILYQTGSLS
jgi:signal recognition particle receptor subunit beta